MTKARSFSIYLLKKQYSTPGKALKADHDLTEVSYPTTVKSSWPTFVASRPPDPPWWRDYFGIPDPVQQGFAGAIVFVDASNRTFALTFGHTAHQLRDEAYEYDFGLRTTLNAVEPDEIRNTDELDPATSRRRRTQLTERADLTYFDFDGDSSVLRSLTGAIRPKYQSLFSHATGASNLRVSTKAQSADLPLLLEKIYDVYKKKTYKTAFPAAGNIRPVKDPTLLMALDAELLTAVKAKSSDVSVTIPEIVNFQDDFEISYSGHGKSKLYLDASSENYYEYLTSASVSFTTLTVDNLKHQRLQIVDDAQIVRAKYSMHKCFVFEVSLSKKKGTFHLTEGTWYRVDDDYLKSLTDYLDARISKTSVPARTMHLESEYNDKQLVPHWPGSVLLDTTNTSPKGEKAIEPCDVIRLDQKHAVLTHVKLGVKSSLLSHLFSQGENSALLLSQSDEALEILCQLVKDRSSTFDTTPIEQRRFKVEYLIVTHNDHSLMSGALPLFSRIGLRRALQTLASMRIDAVFILAGDDFAIPARAKKRKDKAAAAIATNTEDDED